MMKRITEYDNYRSLISDFSDGHKIAYREVAGKAGIHASYFSRVMVGKANFSQEQLFRLGEFMDLADWKLDYLLLLGAWEDSGLSSHRELMAKKLQKIREKYDRLLAQMDNVRNQQELNQVDRALYYESCSTALVHMFLTIRRYRERPTLILQDSRLSQHQLERELKILENLKIIAREKKAIKILQYSVHLDEGDPLLRNHHINWRLEAIDILRYGDEGKKGHHVSAVFSTDQASINRIKLLFKKFVVEAQKEASKLRDEENVYCLTFDLF